MNDLERPPDMSTVDDDPTGPVPVLSAGYRGLLSRGFDEVPTPAEGTPLGGQTGARATESAALFRVHMFPIGQLPVPATTPARQLPPPPPEVDFAAGLRFPPHDHPVTALVAAGAMPSPLLREPAPAAPVPARLTENYHPLSDMPEQEWDRRYVVRSRTGEREYAWPPGELYPEGGQEPAEPVVLQPGTMLDRFGTEAGRVFAAEGTPFARRSLPPTHLVAGYRRYRVVRELPMWQSVSAEWFGQPGGGIRYRATHSAEELVSFGYLADVCEPAEGEQS